MYSTCLFCHHSLGENSRIESFPIGRRLAYDPELGRLWVVCLGCARWNLTPLEERWEAVEQCERLFRGTRLRASSDQIGLAGLGDGFELIRIGRPLRPEFAAWRYGSEFLRRRSARRFVPPAGAFAIGAGVLAGGAVGVTAGVVVAPALAVIGGAVASVPIGFAAWMSLLKRRETRPLTWVLSEGGVSTPITGADANRTDLKVSDEPSGWSLSIIHMHGRREYAGAVARRILGAMMTHINRAGAARDVTDRALGVIDETRANEEPLARLAANSGASGPSYESSLASMPPHLQVAVEMSVHESLERRALQGELEELERAWRQAEEIAAIADNLLLPESVHEYVKRGARSR